MAWIETKPPGNEPIKETVTHLPDNFAYLENALSAEHIFPGSYGHTAGRHSPGYVRAMLYGAASAISAASATPVSGSMRYITKDTDGASTYTLYYYSIDSWKEFPFLHRTLGGNLMIRSAWLDGRDPSVDGTKLDTVSTLATAVGVSAHHGTAIVGADVQAPSATTPTNVASSWKASAMGWLALQTIGKVHGTFLPWPYTQQGFECDTSITEDGIVTTDSDWGDPPAITFCVMIE